jgi:RNA polymerase sigma-70 factor, ECF subfamily
VSDVSEPVEVTVALQQQAVSPMRNAQLDGLFRRHSRELLRFFLRRNGGDRGGAEDLLQDVFLAATTDLEHRAAGTPTLAWLYTVAHRRFVDDLRRGGRRVATVPLDEALVGAKGAQVYGSEVGQALTIVVRRLPEIQQRVFVAKVLEGRSFAEIAERIGTSEGAARMHLMRALKTIRAGLEGLGVDP